MTQDRDWTKKDLQAKTGELKQAQTETAEVKATVATLKTSLDQKTKEAEDAATRATTAEQQLTDTKKQLASAKEAAEKLQETAEAPAVKNAEEISKKVEALGAENKVLGEQMLAMRQSNQQLAASFKGTEHACTLRGRVAVANDLWNFIVVNLGSVEHVKPNTEFLVYRDSMFIAKAKVTVIRPTSSVAELVEQAHGFTKVTPRVGDVAHSGKDVTCASSSRGCC